MNQFLAGAGVSLATLFVKELFDYLRRKAQQELDLKKMYFDMKLETSLKAVAEWYGSAKQLRRYSDALCAAFSSKELNLDRIKSELEIGAQFAEMMKKETGMAVYAFKFFFPGGNAKKMIEETDKVEEMNRLTNDLFKWLSDFTGSQDEIREKGIGEANKIVKIAKELESETDEAILEVTKEFDKYR